MKFRGYDGYADDPDVYPPCDDSILLIKSLDILPGMNVLEIGCGSGIVSIHATIEGAEVTQVDINPKAVNLTIENAKRMNAKLKETKVSDLFQNVQGTFDLILFNLPYLPVEPGETQGQISLSWAGGKDGLGPFKELVEKSPSFLNPNGKLVVVVSSLTNHNELKKIIGSRKTKIIGQESLFFEKLEVLEISFD